MGKIEFSSSFNITRTLCYHLHSWVTFKGKSSLLFIKLTSQNFDTTVLTSRLSRNSINSVRTNYSSFLTLSSRCSRESGSRTRILENRTDYSTTQHTTMPKIFKVEMILSNSTKKKRPWMDKDCLRPSKEILKL